VTTPARIVTAVSFAIAMSSCDFAAASGIADQAVEQFHDRYAAEQWAAIYDAADQQFRRTTNVSDWSDLMTAMRRKLGTFRSTSRRNVNFVSDTAGTTVMQTFDTTFEQGHATEQFGWAISGDHAVLLRYYINSPILVSPIPILR
jgi:hypothetical protein